MRSPLPTGQGVLSILSLYPYKGRMESHSRLRLARVVKLQALQATLKTKTHPPSLSHFYFLLTFFTLQLFSLIDLPIWGFQSLYKSVDSDVDQSKYLLANFLKVIIVTTRV